MSFRPHVIFAFVVLFFLTGCFGIGQTPTGTTDPFGLRRLAIGLIHIIEDQKLPISLTELTDFALKLYGDKLTEDPMTALAKTVDFIKGRFINDQTGQGTALETVEAVTSVVFDDIVDCKYKIMALTTISGEPSFALLASAFKRI